MNQLLLVVLNVLAVIVSFLLGIYVNPLVGQIAIIAMLAIIWAFVFKQWWATLVIGAILIALILFGPGLADMVRSDPDSGSGLFVPVFGADRESSDSGFVWLNYDETDGDLLIPGQSRLIALYLREAEGQGTTQAAMEEAVRLIQHEAASANATTMQGLTLTLPQRQAWLVWCSDASKVDYPTDISDVFDMLPQGPGRIWIQVPFAEGVPLRSDDTFLGCTGEFWAVAVN